MGVAGMVNWKCGEETAGQLSSKNVSTYHSVVPVWIEATNSVSSVRAMAAGVAPLVETIRRYFDAFAVPFQANLTRLPRTVAPFAGETGVALVVGQFAAARMVRRETAEGTERQGAG